MKEDKKKSILFHLVAYLVPLVQDYITKKKKKQIERKMVDKEFTRIELVQITSSIKLKI